MKKIVSLVLALLLALGLTACGEPKEPVIEKLDVVSEKYKVKFILSVSKNEVDLPACAKAKVVISL